MLTVQFSDKREKEGERESAWGRESFIYEAVLVRFRDEIYRVTTMKIDFRVLGF